MDNATLERCKQQLETKAADLSNSLRNRRKIAVETSPDSIEQTVMSAQREFAVGMLDRDSRLLREIRSALARIEDGTYGICESCERAIKPRRLDAVPWTRLCIACREIVDAGSSGDRAESGAVLAA